MTGDAHPIHDDDEYAKKTRYRRRLAHGIVAFVEQTARFRAPAFIGETIYPEHEVLGLERKRSAALLTLRVALKNQRGETVLEHKYLLAYRPARGAD